MFIWCSVEAELKGKLWDRYEGGLVGEAIGLVGIDDDGWFEGEIFAAGPVAGVKKGLHVALYGGKEVIHRADVDTGIFSRSSREPIIMVEGSVGPVVAGSYQTGYAGENTGIYFGLSLGSGSASVGLGFNLDLVFSFVDAFAPAGPDVQCAFQQ